MNKNNVIVILFLLFSAEVYSQNRIDSLESLLPQKKGMELAEILCELAYEYQDVDALIAFTYGQRGLKLAYSLKDTMKIVKIGIVTARALRRQDKMDSAIAIGEKIIILAEKMNYTREMIRILNGLGWAYTANAQYDKALKAHFWNIEILKTSTDTVYKAAAFNNVGIVYYKLGDYKKALNYYLLCMELRLKTKERLDLDRLYINIGLCYSELTNFSEAETYIVKGLAVCGDKCADDIKVEGHLALGIVNYDQHKLVKAEKHFLLSYDIALKTDNFRFIFDNVDYLSQLRIEQKRFREAAHYLHEAEKRIAETALPKEVGQLYLNLSKLYTKTGNCAIASLYQNKYLELRDSVYSQKLTTNLMKTEAEYLEKENNAKILAQDQVLFLKEEIITRQRMLNIVTAALALFIMAFAFILWKNYTRKKKVNVILDEKVRERTVALESSLDEFKKALEENDLLKERAFTNVKNTLSTMQGLCVLGLKDISDTAARQYISQMDKISTHLSANLKSIFYLKD